MVRSTRRRGSILVYTAFAVTVMLGACSLAVDYGRAQMAKTELRRAADAAARYAAAGLQDNTYIAKAIDAANDNKVDGTPVTITSADVIKGYFNSANRTFTANGSPTNAVQVTCSRKGSNGVTLYFARAIGMSKIDITATTITYVQPKLVGFTGLNGIDMKNNTFVGNYSSGTTATPTHADASGAAALSSNGVVSAGSSSTLSGDMYLGPGGSNSGVTLVDGGTVMTVWTSLPTPADPAWAPTGNPGSIPQNYTVSSGTTLPGGTYWFTSLTVSAPVQFSAPATIYVAGDVDLSSTMRAYQGIPGNLRIYQIGSHTFGNVDASGIAIWGVVMAPRSKFVAKNNSTFYGLAVFDTIEVKNNTDFYYDTALGPVTGGAVVSISTVK